MSSTLPPARRASRLRQDLVVAAWVLALVAGSVGMWLHAAGPGEPADAPATWPADAEVARDPAKATLLLFAHPECPCTPASLEVLGRIVAQAGGKVAVKVLFEAYADVAAPEASAAWAQAERLAGAEVRRDFERREAARFGAKTSGQVLVYDAAGALRYAGGLTPSRGEVGESAGKDAVLRILEGTAAAPSAPVYGCSLLSRAKEVVDARP